MVCLFLFSDLDELSTSIDAQNLVRHRSHISESVSETGSERANGSLQRQKSQDSAKGLRHRSVSIEGSKKVEIVGEKLIEVEKAETGSVKWEVYKHYLRSIGIFLTLATILLNVVYQGFSIASNFWLSIWSSDNSTVVNGTVDTGKRDMYLGVYGALGIGQGKFVAIFKRMPSCLL